MLVIDCRQRHDTNSGSCRVAASAGRQGTSAARRPAARARAPLRFARACVAAQRCSAPAR